MSICTQYVVVALGGLSFAAQDIETSDDANSPTVDVDRFDAIARKIEAMASSRDHEVGERLCELAKVVDRLQINSADKGACDYKCQRTLKVRLLLRIGATVESKTNPGFDPDVIPQFRLSDAFLSVPFRFGADPKTFIQDPVLLKEYEALSNTYTEQVLQYNMQIKLARLRDLLVEHYIFPFTRQHFRVDDLDAQQELQDVMTEEIKDEEHRKSLIKELEQLDKKYYVQPGGAVVKRAEPLP